MGKFNRNKCRAGYTIYRTVGPTLIFQVLTTYLMIHDSQSQSRTNLKVSEPTDQDTAPYALNLRVMESFSKTFKSISCHLEMDNLLVNSIKKLFVFVLLALIQMKNQS